MYKVVEWIKKAKSIGYWRIGVIVGCGVLLLILSVPEKEKSVTKAENNIQKTEELTGYIKEKEEKLEQMLSQIEGVGKVKVMITAKSTREHVVLKDEPYSESSSEEKMQDGSGTVSTEKSSQESTVMNASGENGDTPYVTKDLEPEIEGVLVVAEGATSSKMISEINEAIVALFSVPSHKIKVMKMR